MPDTSPTLALPFLAPAQAQKHVTVNEAFRRLDILVQLAVEDFNATTPPASPADGQVWALGAGPTGAWAGQDGALAARIDGAWSFVPPQTGWRAFGRADNSLRVHDGAGWQSVQGAAPDLQNLPQLGINATADATNRLAVGADASLFTHDGAGHQMVLNKAGLADTGSVLFQSGFSGRAEIGLAGNDDLSVKTSADGAAWTTALTFSGTGAASFGADLATIGALTVGGALDVTGPLDSAGAVTLGSSLDVTGDVTTAGRLTTDGLLATGGATQQVTVNKPGSGDTGSVLFQTGFSGRAEIGLTGSDDLSVKTSADGATWTTALTVTADGQTGIGTAAPAQPLHVAGNAQVDGALKLNGALNVGTDDPNPTSNNVPGLRITSGGAVDISASGQFPLELNRAETGAIMQFKNAGVFTASFRVEPDEFSLTSPDNLTFVTKGTEVIRVTTTQKVGIGIAAPVRKLHVSDAMRIEPGSPPSNPAAGDLYFDATTNKLRAHDGTGWNDLF